MTVVLAVVVVAGVAAIIGYPLLRPGREAPLDPIGPAAQLAALQERKLQIYAAIRELGFDYNTDKLEKADYEEEVDRLKREAVEIVRQIDVLRSQPPRADGALEAEIAAARQALPAAAPGSAAGPGGRAGAFCTQCGSPAAPSDRFCGACGTPLRQSG
jgi:hypothetical protein